MDLSCLLFFVRVRKLHALLRFIPLNIELNSSFIIFTGSSYLVMVIFELEYWVHCLYIYTFWPCTYYSYVFVAPSNSPLSVEWCYLVIHPRGKTKYALHISSLMVIFSFYLVALYSFFLPVLALINWCTFVLIFATTVFMLISIMFHGIICNHGQPIWQFMSRPHPFLLLYLSLIITQARALKCFNFV